MTNRQNIDNQRGEVTFRRKLVQQQVEEKPVFEDEFSKTDIERILKERMDVTLRAMEELKNREVILSPYLEIGAERGQRSLVMETDLNLHGAALDLSYDMLKSCEYYKDVFEKKLPVRVCTDLYCLPFKTGSIPFVFCYQTLHHFPDPLPVVDELHRVLTPGGAFMFDEEPFKRGFHLNLYRTRKVFSNQHRSRGVFRKVFDHLFAELSCNEEEHGVIENDNISTAEWRKTFSSFPVKEVKLRSPGRVVSDLYGHKFSLNYILNYIWGGEISGICKKSGDPVPVDYSVVDAFTCPLCLTDGSEPDLKNADDRFVCEGCATEYPVVNNVIFLLKPDQLESLYPEICSGE